MKIKICPMCGELMVWNYYYQRWVCPNCGAEER